ncbi:MAG: helix-turn-helix domain-containing protein [Gordonibacter pamelaeae]
MTPDQVARVLHVTCKCVRDVCVDGRLPGSKAGKLWRIPKPALVDHLAGGRR